MIDGLSSPKGEEMNATIDEKKDDILGALEENEKVPLAKIKSEEFEMEQRNCISLSEIWKMAEGVNNREFEVRKDRLICISHSKKGDEVIQLLIPKKFRKDILKLCHDEISDHLGVQRTKDRILLAELLQGHRNLR